MGIIAYLNLETPSTDGMTVTRFTAQTARAPVDGGRRGETKLVLATRLEIDNLFGDEEGPSEFSQLDLNPSEDRYTELLDRSLAAFEEGAARDAASGLRTLIAMGIAALSPPELEAANESDVEFVKFLRGIEALKVRARLS